MSFRTTVSEVERNSVAKKKLCSRGLTTEDSTTGWPCSMWKQLRRISVTDHDLTVGTQYQDTKKEEDSSNPEICKKEDQNLVQG